MSDSSPVETVASVVRIDPNIKGIMFNVQIRDLALVSPDMHWQVVRVRKQEYSQNQRMLDPTRQKNVFFQGEKVDLLSIVKELMATGFVLSSAEGRTRIVERHDKDQQFDEDDAWEGETYFQNRVRFILHREHRLNPALVANDMSKTLYLQYLKVHGEDSLMRVFTEAVWGVEGIRNTLRAESGFGLCFNCKARVPYRLQSGPNMARRRDPVTKMQVGDPVPIAPEHALRLVGDSIVAAGT